MPLQEPVDLLIEARWVLPIAPVNTVLVDHAVAVSAGRIVALGPRAELAARFEPREIVRRGNHALMPGFVNAHTQAAMTLVRGLPVYGPRARWVRETVSPIEERCMGPDFIRDGTQLAIAEMLRAGITAFADMYLFPEEAARTASLARMHAAIGLPVCEGPTAWAEDLTEYFAKAERLWDEYRSDPWVSLYFAPYTPYSASDETLTRVRRVADELDARIAMHVFEPRVGESESRPPGARAGLLRLRELGLLRPGFMALCSSGLDREELEILATTGVAVVTCPQAGLRLGGDVCDVAALDAAGLCAGLGTDSPASVGALDMLAEARVAALWAASARCGGTRKELAEHIRPAPAAEQPSRAAGPHEQPSRLAGEASVRDSAARQGTHRGIAVSECLLRAATLGGAQALGLGSLVGSIEPGKVADLVCLDLSSLACQPPSRPADAIVFAATRGDVSDVWTAGRAAVSDGRLLAFDEQELLALTRGWAERVFGEVMR